MTQPNLVATHTHVTLDELDRRVHDAEDGMNRALEQRRWDMARSHRHDMLVAIAEVRRRLDAIDHLASSPPEDEEDAG